MNPDDFIPNRPTIDEERLMKELRRKQEDFAAIIVSRDAREVGTGLLLLPFWFFVGFKLAMPWTWYLMVPVLVWIAGAMLGDLVRHRRRPPEPGEPLRQSVERFKAEVERQIWLLRRIFWWYLLPPALAILAFFGQIGWQTRSEGWLTALVVVGLFAVVLMVFAGVYRLNQDAVRSDLLPRRRELEALLVSLRDENP